MITRSHGAEIITLLKKTGGWSKERHASSSCDRVDMHDLIDAFGPGGSWHAERGGVHAPEEVFFPTMLALLGYLRPDHYSHSHDEVLRQAVTFASWRRESDANPISHAALTPSLLAQIRATPSLFARKFARDSVDVKTWRELVLSSRPTSDRKRKRDGEHSEEKQCKTI